MLTRQLTRGLSARIYFSFLVIALVPVLIAGLVGIYFSLEALKRETLAHLESEVRSRADAVGRFVDQLASELHYLVDASALRELADAADAAPQDLRTRIEGDFSAFARIYPFIYQIRAIDRSGREQVRVDRRDGRIHVVPEANLQDKSQRYYVRDALALGLGRIYVSPLDLNIERGEIELPERPVVRFATGIPNRDGELRGILIVNLHADFVLRNIRELGGTRGGEAFLFDRSGHFLRWSPNSDSRRFEMRPVAEIADTLPNSVVAKVLNGEHGTTGAGNRIVAYAPIVTAGDTVSSITTPLRWSIALAYPERLLLAAVFNLYLLYAVLALALILTAAGGFLLSRRLLRPLSRLKTETQEIAEGNFAHRVDIRGEDEIAELGRSFNRMAGEIERMLGQLSRRRDELEELVAARTAQIALERQNLDSVVQNSADGIVALDEAGRVAVANQAAADLLGLARDHLLGATLVNELPALAVLFARRTGDGKQRLEHEGRILDVVVSAIALPDGRAKHVLVLRDMTEEQRLHDTRRELDRQMFQAEKISTMGELAMGIAHEIGNPLAGMKAVAQALLDEEALSERTREYLQRLEAEIDRLSAFLHPFHGFAAAQETRIEPTSLTEAVADVILWTRKEAKTKGIVIDTTGCAPDTPLLAADPNQLKQMLLNLVINAIHAMDEGGCLRLHADPGANGSGIACLRIVVEDDGTGIASDVLPRVFDPFYSTRTDGSGLGLAIVRKIAADHGVEIALDSVPGRGTRVELLWPIAAPAIATENKQRRGRSDLA